MEARARSGRDRHGAGAGAGWLGASSMAAFRRRGGIMILAGGVAWRVRGLRLQICSDLAKNAFAEENGMSFLRIAYSDCKSVKNMEMWVREFLDYCQSTTTPNMFFSNPELYQKTAEIVRPK